MSMSSVPSSPKIFRSCGAALKEAHQQGLEVIVKEGMANGRWGPKKKYSNNGHHFSECIYFRGPLDESVSTKSCHKSWHWNHQHHHHQAAPSRWASRDGWKDEGANKKGKTHQTQTSRPSVKKHHLFFHCFFFRLFFSELEMNASKKYLIFG